MPVRAAEGGNQVALYYEPAQRDRSNVDHARSHGRLSALTLRERTPSDMARAHRPASDSSHMLLASWL
jgi:hypothetical protein